MAINDVSVLRVMRKILFTVVISVFALWAIIWCWSSLLTVKVEKTINAWEDKKIEFNLEESNNYIPRLQRSLALNPFSANTNLLLARLYDLKTIYSNTIDAPHFFENAEKNYKLAIQKQPTWDYAWAKLANHYHLLNINTKQVHNTNLLLKTTLIKAMNVGPYERSTQRVIIPLIFKYWQLINTSEQHLKLTRKILIHATTYRDNRNLTFNMAKNHNLITKLLPLIKDKKQRKILLYYQKLIDKAFATTKGTVPNE